MKTQSLPLYPRTPHLKTDNNTIFAGDISITAEKAFEILKNAENIEISEKMDGSNVRICFDGDERLILGNRTKILNRAYSKKETPAKLQFRPLWNWIYSHKEEFYNLNILLDNYNEIPIVYGEWLFAKHTLYYDSLPSLFMAYDIFIDGKFLDPVVSRNLLEKAGFRMPLTFQYQYDSQFKIKPDISMLESLAQGISGYGPEMEGIYIKAGDGLKNIFRCKIVKKGFKPREDFNDTEIFKNKLKKDK